MNARGATVAMVAVLAAACSRSHAGSDRDAAADAPVAPDDAHASADAGGAGDGLAPACAEAPQLKLRIEDATTFHLGGVDSGGKMLHGLAHTADGPRLLYVEVVSLEGGHENGLPRIRRFSPAGEDQGPLLLEEGVRYDESRVRGDLLARPDGGVLAAVRVGLYEDSSPGARFAGSETRVFELTGGEVEALEARHEQRHGDAATASYVDSGRAWVLSTLSDGVVGGPAEETEPHVEIRSEPQPRGELRAAPLDAGRLAVAWSAGDPSGFEPEGWQGRAAVVSMDGSVEAEARVFPSVPADYNDVHMVTWRSHVWVARFTKDHDSLRDSRIRVAQLDGSLERVAPDRWLNGWGGLTPAGMALVVWRDRPWVVWRTLDVRYGGNPTLYVQPLVDEACGYRIDRPLAVMRPHNLDGRVLAAAADDSLWIAAGHVRGDGTADLYRVVADE